MPIIFVGRNAGKAVLAAPLVCLLVLTLLLFPVYLAVSNAWEDWGAAAIYQISKTDALRVHQRLINKEEDSSSFYFRGVFREQLPNGVMLYGRSNLGDAGITYYVSSSDPKGENARSLLHQFAIRPSRPVKFNGVAYAGFTETVFGIAAVFSCLTVGSRLWEHHGKTWIQVRAGKQLLRPPVPARCPICRSTQQISAEGCGECDAKYNHTDEEVKIDLGTVTDETAFLTAEIVVRRGAACLTIYLRQPKRLANSSVLFVTDAQGLHQIARAVYRGAEFTRAVDLNVFRRIADATTEIAMVSGRSAKLSFALQVLKRRKYLSVTGCTTYGSRSKRTELLIASEQIQALCTILDKANSIFHQLNVS